MDSAFVEAEIRCQVFYKDTSYQLTCYGYEKNKCKIVGFYISVTATLGILYLVTHWLPTWRIKLTCDRCPSARADYVILLDPHNKSFVEQVVTYANPCHSYTNKHNKYSTFDIPNKTFLSAKNSEKVRFNRSASSIFLAEACIQRTRYFEHRHIRFVWHSEDNHFKPLSGLKVTAENSNSSYRGLSSEERQKGLSLYGPNSLSIEVKSYTYLLFKEILNPFYVFQIFSISLWIAESYYIYAVCILFISIVSISVELYETKRQQIALRQQMSAENQFVTVLLANNQEQVNIPSDELVPGDVIIIPDHSGFVLPCDCVLISGSAITDEGMLTGESIPVTKTPFTADRTATSPGRDRNGTQKSNVANNNNKTAQSLPAAVDGDKKKGEEEENNGKKEGGGGEEGENKEGAEEEIEEEETNRSYSAAGYRRSTLFCGTKVLQTRQLSLATEKKNETGSDKTKAVVTRTGFYTLKGELIRIILFPKPINFAFYSDVFRFILFLAIVGLCGLIYTVFALVYYKQRLVLIILKSLDIITVAVPPALPAAMTIGTVYSQARLKKSNIFCISPQTINICGKINCFCFDKTGTLTEEGLDLRCVIGSRDGQFDASPLVDPINLDRSPNDLVVAMATCHGLNVIGGEVMGDPLDLVMFNSVKWVIVEPTTEVLGRFYDAQPIIIVKPIKMDSYDSPYDSHYDSPYDSTHTFYSDAKEIGVMRQFPFESELQRMSVIVRRITDPNRMIVYVKGAPEKIVSLCLPQTVPKNFNDKLSHYSSRGFRMVALATKRLEKDISYEQLMNLSRNTVESSLNFLGLMVLENKVKVQTNDVLGQLHQADIRTVMLTGDNILTAISVARQCGMIGPLDRILELGTYEKNNNNVADNKEEDDQNDEKNGVKNSGENGGENGVYNFVVGSENRKFDSSKFGIFWNDTGSNMAFSISAGDFYESYPESGSGFSGSKSDVFKLIEDKHPDSRRTINSVHEMERIHSVERGKLRLAITGENYSVVCRFFPELIPKLTVYGTVYARMSPDQKTSVVQNLQKACYTVGMCGDGANDCGALRMANAGISLSDLEASVAAPFTSKSGDISCVLSLIREGRAALTTSFGAFKFMATNSLVQFISVVVLFSQFSILQDMMYLYIDLFIVTSCVVLMGYTEPSDSLSRHRPDMRLASLANIFAILINLLVVTGFQISTVLFLSVQTWYHADKAGKIEVPKQVATCVFFVSLLQYIVMAFAYSKGPPFRKRIWTNVWLTLTLLALIIFSTFLILFDHPFMRRIFQSVSLPLHFRLTIVCISVINFLAIVIFEDAFFASRYHRSFWKRVTCRGQKPDNHHKQIVNKLDQDPTWPPIP